MKGADAGSIDGLMCPVGGADVMGKVADLLGMAVANIFIGMHGIFIPVFPSCCCGLFVRTVPNVLNHVIC